MMKKESLPKNNGFGIFIQNYFMKFFSVALFLLFSLSSFAQQKSLDFFINKAIAGSPAIIENTNLQQNFELQNQIIAAQNKKPLVNFTADYLFTPFFFDNGKPVSVTNNPSPKAYGYDVGVTNGGLYSALVNVALPILNKTVVKDLYQQNKAQAGVSAANRLQLVHELQKNITDQYITAYQYQVQGKYLNKILDQVQSRKPIIAALIKQGLLQQNDYLLLEIEELNTLNDLKQLQFSFTNSLLQLKALAAETDTALYTLDVPAIAFTTLTSGFYYQQKFLLDSLNLVADQDVYNTKYLPQVNLLASTGLNATVLNTIPHSFGIGAGFHVAIPISDGKQKKLNERKNKILLQNLQAYRNAASITMQNNLRNALVQVQQWRQTIDLLNEQLQKQDLLLDIIKEKVVKGQVSVTDYVTALQNYALVQKNKAVAETNVLLYTNLYNYYNW